MLHTTKLTYAGTLNKDFAWLAQSMKEWLVPIFLWWSTKARNKTFEEDLTI